MQRNGWLQGLLDGAGAVMAEEDACSSEAESDAAAEEDLEEITYVPFLQCNSYAFCLHSFYLAQGLE